MSEYQLELEPAGDYLILDMRLYEEERYGRADRDVSLLVRHDLAA